jgi:plastocyanin
VTRVPRRGVALLALAGPLVLGGCGGTTSSTSAGASSSGPPAGSPASTSSCATLRVTGSEVTPAPATVDVKAGCAVRLAVTADRTSEVHVHVVNIERPITAGKPLTVEFTPTQPGVYEVELHDPDLLLVKLAVR